MIPLEKQEQDGWQAHLLLRFAAKNNKTILREKQHQGPLTVQRPLYPENDVCHTYLLHPPGGVVGGDRLHLDIFVEKNGAALITTPGATKFYRSEGAIASQIQKLHVNSGCLEWFPQDNILFPGANAKITTEITLKGDSRFIGWEVLSLGLPATNTAFSPGSLFSSLKLFHEDKPLFLDSLRVTSATDLYSSSCLRGFSVAATFLATNVESDLLADLRELLPKPDETRIVAVTLMDRLLVGRYLGNSTFEARGIFEQLWSRLRPALINRSPCPPRIWAT